MVHIPLWVLALLIVGSAVVGGLVMLGAVARAFSDVRR